MGAIRGFLANHRGVAGFSAGLLLSGALAGGGAAIAAIPSSSNGNFTGCVNKISGAVRIIDYQAGRRCTTKERSVNWSKGYRYRGAWSARTSYAVLDVVFSQRSSYIAKAASSGRTPSSSPAYWGLLAAAGATGATGPAGPTGPQGPAGPTGAVGPPGSGGTTLWAVVRSDGTVERGSHVTSAAHAGAGATEVVFDQHVSSCAFAVTPGGNSDGTYSPGEGVYVTPEPNTNVFGVIVRTWSNAASGFQWGWYPFQIAVFC